MGPVEKILREANDIWHNNPTKGCFARDEQGWTVSPVSDKATCWCALGAMYKAKGELSRFVGEENAFDVLESACQEVVGNSYALIADVNDNTDLMSDVFSEAIEAAAALGL